MIIILLDSCYAADINPGIVDPNWSSANCSRVIIWVLCELLPFRMSKELSQSAVC